MGSGGDAEARGGLRPRLVEPPSLALTKRPATPGSRSGRSLWRAGNSPRPSTYCRSGRRNQDGKGSVLLQTSAIWSTCGWRRASAAAALPLTC